MTVANYVDVPISNQKISCDRPKALKAKLAFAAGADEFDLPLTNISDFDVFEDAQSMYIDNSDNAEFLIVTAKSGHRTIVKPGYQGYYPVLVAPETSITVSSVGSTATVFIFIMNVPMPCNEWDANP